MPPITNGNALLLTGDRGFVHLAAVDHWSRLRSGENRTEEDSSATTRIQEVPGLAAGRYAAIWSPEPQWELAARACAGAFPEADWQALPPGGEAMLVQEFSR